MMMIQKTRTLHLLLNEIIPDDDLDDVELSEEDDDDDYEDETND